QGQSFSFMDIAIMLYAFFPPALFIGLKIFDRVWYLNPILMLIGGTGLLFYRQWMGWINASFMKRRYVMMEGFRAKV
ncbi:MAG TPA: hypothetical protein VK470_20145, partial [Bacteroidota bacterium]|nr:hypothetical protein [Bacteroidota bacterium]